MEKHKCKLCFKSFANGRALGGHMRSHMMNLPIQPKPHQQPIQLKEVEAESPIQLKEVEAESADSASASSSSSSEDEGEEKLLGYGLRENPKKSFRLVDPEFSFAIDGGSVSVVVQDRESETESSKNPTRRRSKRTRKLCNAERQCQQQEQETTKKVKFYKPINSKAESWVEPEPVSSISDATTEEDVAFCLMMLSRDKWMKDEEGEEEEEEEEKSMEEYLYEYEETKPCKTNRVKGKFYKCETCKKTFRSYQALGGHRASHKKIRLLENAAAAAGTATTITATNNTSPASDKKIHECPVCFRVFSSGQALGGHKRSHAITDSAAAVATKNNSAKFGDNWIDLNLPAPMEDDEISQIELSAVSDGDFVNHTK